jgi:hypothetical protein
VWCGPALAMAPKRRTVGAGSTHCVYAADGRCDGGGCHPPEACVECGRLVHPWCATKHGGYEEDAVHCAAKHCSTYNEEQATAAGKRLADRLAEEAAAAEGAEAEAAQAAAQGQAAAAAPAAVAPVVADLAAEVPAPVEQAPGAVPLSVDAVAVEGAPPPGLAAPPVPVDPPVDGAALPAGGDGEAPERGENAAAAALGVQVAQLDPTPPPPAAPAQRPDGSFKCDGPDCTRDADNASGRMMQACTLCGELELCIVCRRTAPSPAVTDVLTSVCEQHDNITVCPGCLFPFLREEEADYFEGQNAEWRAVVGKECEARHASMLVTRAARMRSSAAAAAPGGIAPAALHESLGQDTPALGDTERAAATPAVVAGSLVMHNIKGIGCVQEVDTTAETVTVGWLQGNAGFQPVASTDTEFDKYPLTNRVLLPLREIVLYAPTGGGMKVRPTSAGFA